MSTIEELAAFCDQPDFYLSRNWDAQSDHFGWWWAAWRNGKAYEGPNLIAAIERAKAGGP